MVNSCLLQPYSIVKVGDGAGEGRRLFYSTWRAPAILEHFITKTGLPTQRALRTPWSHAQPLNSLASRVPPQILHIPLFQNLQNGPFKAQAKRYSKRTHKNTGKFALF